MRHHRAGMLATTAIMAAVATAPAGAQSEPVAVKPVHVRPAFDSTADSASRADSAAAPPRTNCWRAQRRPPCAGFFLTELGMEAPVYSTRVDRRAARDAPDGPRSGMRGRIVWSFGFMGTSGAGSHGATVSLTTEEPMTSRIPFAVEYRYRRWLRGRRALDFALGYREMHLWNDAEGFSRVRGITAMAGYTLNQYAGLSLRGDLMRAAGRPRRALLVGIRSTRLSEVMIRYTAIAIARTLLARIGVELDEGNPRDESAGP